MSKKRIDKGTLRQLGLAVESPLVPRLIIRVKCLSRHNRDILYQAFRNRELDFGIIEYVNDSNGKRMECWLEVWGNPADLAVFTDPIDKLSCVLSVHQMVPGGRDGRLKGMGSEANRAAFESLPRVRRDREESASESRRTGRKCATTTKSEEVLEVLREQCTKRFFVWEGDGSGI